ncbi:helix-turn-helix domain-containing protein [Candidatus Neomarinimicrobiota bacterium]
MNKSKKNNVSMGQRLRSIRQQLGDTQTIFGARFQLNRDDIANYERGLAEPPANLMAGLELLGYSISWLVSGNGQKREVDLLRQRCEDLAREVEELKRSIRDAKIELNNKSADPAKDTHSSNLI